MIFLTSQIIGFIYIYDSKTDMEEEQDEWKEPAAGLVYPLVVEIVTDIDSLLLRGEEQA